MADLVQKVTELDVRCTAETAPLLPLKVTSPSREVQMSEGSSALQEKEHVSVLLDSVPTVRSPACARCPPGINSQACADHEASSRNCAVCECLPVAAVERFTCMLFLLLLLDAAAYPICQERNVAMELDLARAAMETVVRQLATVSKSNQVSTVLIHVCARSSSRVNTG